MDKEKLVHFFQRAGQLKNIKRAGWVRAGIAEPESVADHCFRTALMAMVLGDLLDVDSGKLVKMALLHDVAEIVAGDITPHDGIAREDKSSLEREGLEELLQHIPWAGEYIGLWQEYEEQRSVEAELVKNIDKLEMALQAMEYQHRYPDLDLSEFIEEAKNFICHPEIIDLFISGSSHGHPPKN
ncbi:MAG: HD domain-containing protein [Thermoplasmata archaeon]|nr:MAG: HD domain-containing protein [Thermoplasmata archaeon]